VSFLLDYKHLCVENYAKQYPDSEDRGQHLQNFEHKKGDNLSATPNY